MAIKTLTDLYIDQLQDLSSADAQSLEVTRKLAAAATNAELKDALNAGVSGIERGLHTVNEIVKSHGADPGGEFCKGMQGLVAEAEAHCLNETFDDPDVRDAMIITQYQRMAHYAIAGYGCVFAFAKRLGLSEDARKLKDCLENTKGGDKHMSEIATKEINEEAMSHGATASSGQIDALKQVLTRLVDSADGYEEAVSSAKDGRLGDFIRARAAERRRFVGDVRQMMDAHGAEPASNGSILASAHRMFSNIRASLGKDQALIEEMVRGERNLLQAYDKALETWRGITAVEEVLTRHRGAVSREIDQLQAMEAVVA